MFTLPSPPILTTTRLGTVCPATKLRFAALGGGTSDGYTVRWLGAVGSVTVVFTMTADTAGGSGTPEPWVFVTSTERTAPSPEPILPAAGTPMGPYGAGRVSRMRFGGSGVNTSPLDAPYQPTMSKMTSVDPLLLRTFTLPPPAGPTLTATRLGTVCPGTKFRLAALGATAASDGYTVRWLAAVGPVTVTLTMTAVTTESGTPEA